MRERAEPFVFGRALRGGLLVMPSSVVSAHEMLEGGRNAMTFIESGPSAYSGQKYRAGFRLSPGTSSQWAARLPAVERDSQRRKRTVTFGRGGAQSAHKTGCAQCAHPGPRIRLDRRRTGSDCGGFRGSGGFSRVGARFEFHLGHSVSAGKKPFGPLTRVDSVHALSAGSL
jgi:hypothetical protein